ncbi:methyltransferase domain-containing protein [Thiovibrio sp. JS02]
MSNKTGDGILADNANWTFSGEVVESFESHAEKSIPFYREGHELVIKLSDYFVKDDSICYELGSSCGTLSDRLAGRHHFRRAKFIGIEKETDMVGYAKTKYRRNNLNFVHEDVNGYEYQKSDFMVSYYLIQFIRPSQRQQLFDKIYQSLNWGGAFVLFEKVRACDARFQDIMTGLYTDYKIEQGYTSEEIINKSRSLKGVLEPFSTQGNIDLLKRAGFIDIISVMKYLCFEGFLAIK